MAKKLVLDVDEQLWIDVQKYKLDHKLGNNNKAVIELIKIGLKKK